MYRFLVLVCAAILVALTTACVMRKPIDASEDSLRPKDNLHFEARARALDGQPVHISELKAHRGIPKGIYAAHNDHGQNLVYLFGPIEKGDALKLIHLVKKTNAVGVVLQSDGGNVGEAVDMARYIRAKGISTLARQDCLSACVIVHAGGVKRGVSKHVKTRFGVHRTTKGRYVGHSARILRDWLSPELLDLANATPNRKVHYIEGPRMRQYNLVTR